MYTDVKAAGLRLEEPIITMNPLDIGLANEIRIMCDNGAIITNIPVCYSNKVERGKFIIGSVKLYDTTVDVSKRNKWVIFYTAFKNLFK